MDDQSPCVFTKGLERMELPVRHGEGKFFTTADILGSLVENHQIAVQYALPDGQLAQGAFPANPNGSIMDIAGICDPTGRVFGLMPHPEGFNHWTNHPEWTRSSELAKRGMAKAPDGVAPGIRIFKNAVDYFR
jgi:phosphoribosylformylglycinamidine synthase